MADGDQRKCNKAKSGKVSVNFFKKFQEFAKHGFGKSGSSGEPNHANELPFRRAQSLTTVAPAPIIHLNHVSKKGKSGIPRKVKDSNGQGSEKSLSYMSPQQRSSETVESSSKLSVYQKPRQEDLAMDTDIVSPREKGDIRKPRSFTLQTLRTPDLNASLGKDDSQFHQNHGNQSQVDNKSVRKKEAIEALRQTPTLSLLKEVQKRLKTDEGGTTQTPPKTKPSLGTAVLRTKPFNNRSSYHGQTISNQGWHVPKAAPLRAFPDQNRRSFYDTSDSEVELDFSGYQRRGKENGDCSHCTENTDSTIDIKVIQICDSNQSPNLTENEMDQEILNERPAPSIDAGTARSDSQKNEPSKFDSVGDNRDVAGESHYSSQNYNMQGVTRNERSSSPVENQWYFFTENSQLSESLSSSQLNSRLHPHTPPSTGFQRQPQTPPSAFSQRHPQAPPSITFPSQPQNPPSGFSQLQPQNAPSAGSQRQPQTQPSGRTYEEDRKGDVRGCIDGLFEEEKLIYVEPEKRTPKLGEQVSARVLKHHLESGQNSHKTGTPYDVYHFSHHDPSEHHAETSTHSYDSAYGTDTAYPNNGNIINRPAVLTDAAKGATIGVLKPKSMVASKRHVTRSYDDLLVDQSNKENGRFARPGEVDSDEEAESEVKQISSQYFQKYLIPLNDGSDSFGHKSNSLPRSSSLGNILSNVDTDLDTTALPSSSSGSSSASRMTPDSSLRAQAEPPDEVKRPALYQIAERCDFHRLLFNYKDVHFKVVDSNFEGVQPRIRPPCGKVSALVHRDSAFHPISSNSHKTREEASKKLWVVAIECEQTTSVAVDDSTLRNGDLLIEINEVYIANMYIDEVREILSLLNDRDQLSVLVAREKTTPAPAAQSSTDLKDYERIRFKYNKLKDEAETYLDNIADLQMSVQDKERRAREAEEKLSVEQAKLAQARQEIETKENKIQECHKQVHNLAHEVMKLKRSLLRKSDKLSQLQCFINSGGMETDRSAWSHSSRENGGAENISAV